MSNTTMASSVVEPSGQDRDVLNDLFPGTYMGEVDDSINTAVASEGNNSSDGGPVLGAPGIIGEPGSSAILEPGYNPSSGFSLLENKPPRGTLVPAATTGTSILPGQPSFTMKLDKGRRRKMILNARGDEVRQPHNIRSHSMYQTSKTSGPHR